MADETQPKTTKPGWQTTEFLLSAVASIIGLLFASGIIGAGTVWDQALGIVATILSTLGYTVSRTIVKK